MWPGVTILRHFLADIDGMVDYLVYYYKVIITTIVAESQILSRFFARWVPSSRYITIILADIQKCYAVC